MAGVRNLTRVGAMERACLLDVTGYDVTLDLTDTAGGPGSGTFRSTTRVAFTCTVPGASLRWSPRARPARKPSTPSWNVTASRVAREPPPPPAR